MIRRRRLLGARPPDILVMECPGVLLGEQRGFGKDVDEGLARREASCEGSELPKLRLEEPDWFACFGTPCHLGKNGTEHVKKRPVE